MSVNALCEKGIAYELTRRGVDNPELVAKGLMRDAKADAEGSLTLEGLPVEQFIELKFGQQQTSGEQQPTTQDAGGTGDQGFTPENALKDPKLYEEWLEKDPEGCQKAMLDYERELANANKQ